MQLEQSLVKVPVEQLNKSFRGVRKLIERELSGSDVAQKARALKRKLQECQQEDQRLLQLVKNRNDHLLQLNQMQSVDDEQFMVWTRVRLVRLTVDYLLRRGYFDAAQALAVKY